MAEFCLYILKIMCISENCFTASVDHKHCQVMDLGLHLFKDCRIARISPEIWSFDGYDRFVNLAESGQCKWN